MLGPICKTVHACWQRHVPHTYTVQQKHIRSTLHKCAPLAGWLLSPDPLCRPFFGPPPEQAAWLSWHAYLPSPPTHCLPHRPVHVCVCAICVRMSVRVCINVNACVCTLVSWYKKVHDRCPWEWFICTLHAHVLDQINDISP
jgi:hypothetical protein